MPFKVICNGSKNLGGGGKRNRTGSGIGGSGNVALDSAGAIGGAAC